MYLPAIIISPLKNFLVWPEKKNKEKSQRRIETVAHAIKSKEWLKFHKADEDLQLKQEKKKNCQNKRDLIKSK